MTHTIESERAKYDREYLGTDPDGHFTKHHGLPLMEFIDHDDPAVLEQDISSWIDVGCGAGSMLAEVIKRNFHSIGHGIAAVDISEHAFSAILDAGYEHLCTTMIAPAHRIPTQNTYRIVTACDLLEHLPPEWVIPTLEEFKRLMSFDTQYGFTISSDPWRDLHLTVEPRAWWLEQIKAVFGDVEIKGYGPVYYFRITDEEIDEEFGIT